MIDAGAPSPNPGAPSVELLGRSVWSSVGERAGNGASGRDGTASPECHGEVTSTRRRTVDELATVHLTDWVLTHWTFRYGDGLRGRALVGSLLGWSTDDPVAPRPP